MLIEDLPTYRSFVIHTDGGSNPGKEDETGWGVLILRKNAHGCHPTVVAELFGPVVTDHADDYYVGAAAATKKVGGAGGTHEYLAC